MSALETETWFRQYGESVHRRCLKIMRNEAEAWDITQDVFVRAHRNAAALKDQKAVLSWLLTIADRCCFTCLRKNRTAVRRESHFELESGGPELARNHLEAAVTNQRTVIKLLARFPNDIQQIVALRYLDELELEEIAILLGYSAKTVKRRLDKFLKKSKRLLEES